MNGNTLIAKILKAEGIEWIACFPAQKLIDAAAEEGIRPIITRQERAGVNMADGFSRINNGNKIGVFCMQRGPGSENAYGGIAQAYADSVPILVLPGGSPRNRIGVHPAFEAVENYRGITKWSGHINMVERIPELLGKAFSMLKHGRPGPVSLEIPEDVGDEEFPDGSFQYTPITKHLSGANPSDVKDLVTELLKAENPVINAGQGVLYAQASNELVEFAELTKIPVMTTLNGKGAFPENHHLSLGAGIRYGPLTVHHFLKKTDFILGMGTSFTMSSFITSMPRGVTLAQSTNCPEDINKDYRINFGAIGDSKIVLQQMIDEAKHQLGEGGRKDKKGIIEEIRRVRESFMTEWLPILTSKEIPINPYRVIYELANGMELSNTIITHDSGYPREQLAPIWKTITPNGYIGWGKSTQLGYGLGLAMGAKLAAPEKHVINIMGDAAFGMAGMDIETAARSKIGILTVVLNNGVMTNYSKHMPFATENWDSNRLSGDYSKIAEGLGAYSQKIDTPDQIAPAIQNAITANQSGQPALLEIMCKEETKTPQYEKLW